MAGVLPITPTKDKIMSATTNSGSIFKAFKDLAFEETVSHQCGVTMNDSVEARAIA